MPSRNKKLYSTVHWWLLLGLLAGSSPSVERSINSGQNQGGEAIIEEQPEKVEFKGDQEKLVKEMTSQADSDSSKQGGDGFGLPGKVLLEVPFTAQSPFGGWDDLRERDGCEESSVLMAVSWARGLAITPNIAQTEIRAMSDFDLKKIGEFRDQSNEDTLDLMRDYFSFNNARIIEGINGQDIKEALAEGKVVILGVNGHKLYNPNFLPPGPPNHKIVVVGYDDEEGEFITHDPGTSQGQNYRYKYDTLENAIEDYPTGYHEKFPEPRRSMIVVGTEL